MDTRSQKVCALSGLVGVTLILVGLIVADFLPLPHADWTPSSSPSSTSANATGSAPTS